MSVMKKYITGVLFLFLFFSSNAFSQSVKKAIPKTPKVGLCLSGGGAKGIAHISLLKAIDSLGIKIDCITGTSMGSIIGGLYAIGYSGEELDSLISNVEWDNLLSNTLPLSEVSVDEKDEYARYLVELPISKTGIDLPTGVVEGHALLAFLQKLTFRAAHITDFNKFPIPFKCMGADILTGEPFVIDKGNLGIALRASMSIPTFFSPIEREGHLLVDGGLVKNFPVDILRSMGADLVIGGYTGGKLYAKDELNSMVKLLYQSASFNRITDSELQKKLCSVLADFDKSLNEARFSTVDFKKIRPIIKIGNGIVEKILPQLREIAKMQHDAGVYPTKFLRTRGLNFSGEIGIKKVRVFGLADNETDLDNIIVKFYGKTSLQQKNIAQGVSDMYGSRQFKKVYYELESDSFGSKFYNLNILAAPANKVLLKVGLHYDTDLGAGINFVLQVRNLFLTSSRFIAGMDLSENPKLRLDYRKNLGRSEFWINAHVYGERISQPLFFASKVEEENNRSYYSTKAFLNYSFNKNTFVGIGYGFEYTKYNPRLKSIEQSATFKDTATYTSKYDFRVHGIRLQFLHNSLDHIVFPKSGALVSLQGRLGLNFLSTYVVDSVFKNAVVNQEITQYSEGVIFKVLVHAEKTFNISDVSRKLTFIPHIYFGYRSVPKTPERQYLDFDGDLFSVGGVTQRADWSTIPFWGNREVSVTHSTFASAQFAFQYQLSSNLYVIPALSFLTGTGIYSDNFNLANPLGLNFNIQYFSGGITLGLRTAVGPIIINVSKASNDESYRTYFGLGFRF